MHTILGYLWQYITNPKAIIALSLFVALMSVDVAQFCTGFGMTGPYAARKGYDTVFQAMGGIMSVTGHPGGLRHSPDQIAGRHILSIAHQKSLIGRSRRSRTRPGGTYLQRPE